jgi:hypothetical protein
MEEIWKDIKCIGSAYSKYEVSNLGRVKNTKTGNILTPQINSRNGYYIVGLSGFDGQHKTVFVHKLVAETFLGERPYKHDINHIDGNKLNNAIDNLEYCTRSENVSHAYETGLNPLKTSIRIVETGEIYDSINECTRAIGASRKNIALCLNPQYSRNTHMGYHFEVVNETQVSTSPKPIRIIETREIFDSVRECAEAIDGSHTQIIQAIERNGAYKDLHFEYLPNPQPVKANRKTNFLYPYQLDAVRRMRNGCILNGGVGSGKSRTSLFYYLKECGGWIDEDGYTPMTNPKDLIIITTAQKRNLMEWEEELDPFLLYPDQETHLTRYGNKIIVDSWNVIKKYEDITNAFFIFDEDRVTGTGAWVKSFKKIAKNNDWIILSASPGDRWEDYAAVFIANGFFRNITEFRNEHLVYSQYVTNFPKVTGYRNETRLIRLRDRILIDMDFDRKTNPIHTDVSCTYDIAKYKDAIRNRWDPYKDEPITQASGLCYVLRRIVNTDESRQVAVLELLEKHPRAIIFYNHDHELDILLSLAYPEGTVVAQYNGHRHDALPESERWVYLVNYNAGNSGWNCIKTNCIIFYSQNYSYKVMLQSAGRIDRLNTPYENLYYYHLKSRSGIDLAISKALKNKKQFNERKFTNWDDRRT